jgi:dolichol-phosphate mannosyltransferase
MTAIMHSQQIVCVISAHDEEPTIGQVVEDVFDCHHQMGINVRVIVAADHCTDRTAQVAHIAGAEVLTLAGGTRGLGRAFSAGVAAALASRPIAILHIDADGQYDCGDIPRLVDRFARGADLVIGNRLHVRPVGMTRSRYMHNAASSRVLGACLGLEVADAQSGFRLFGERVAQMPIRSTFTYVHEQLARTAAEDLQIAFVPIAFRPRTYGCSRLAPTISHYVSESASGFVRHTAPAILKRQHQRAKNAWERWSGPDISWMLRSSL